ncbi:olfactory receptor 11G2-like [Mus pahari]|uniref:olfactory receptor 11G2-like n=1 Tax=Mus pahari TaxID=10093 RepID=UPI000A312FC5|nr:olfactory receptor 11G2-like [Mus pahari]
MKTFSSPINSSTITGFILLGFPYPREGQILLFVLFFIVYLLILMGNASIICAVFCDQRLHTPMYLLLANFSFLEIWYVTSTVPNMLANCLSENKVISFSGCFLQFYFFFSFGSTECIFLSIMAFDPACGRLMKMYLSPTSEHDSGMQKLVTLFYSVGTPLLNPVIYSLRNKDMKNAMQKMLRT